REQLADIEAGDVGANCVEQAANFIRSAGLEVERFQMARPAVSPEENHREIAIGSSGLLGCQELSEIRRPAGTKGAKAQAADFQPSAAIHRSRTGSYQVRHGKSDLETSDQSNTTTGAVLRLRPLTRCCHFLYVIHMGESQARLPSLCSTRA